MSQIAHALAKAKERTGYAVSGRAGSLSPFSSERVAASVVRKAQARHKIWWAIMLFALPVTVFVIWFQIRENFGTEEIVSPPAAAVATSDDVSGAIAQAAATSSVNPSRTTVTAQAPAKTTPAEPRPSPEFLRTVNSLSISAVMPGQPARMVLNGRVVRSGDAVVPGLIFTGIADGELRFADSNGATYARRY